MPISRTEVIIILCFLIFFILVMVSFIVIILFFVQKKQKGFVSDLNAVKANYDKELYKAQLEIQEQTFQEISREIHDNVGQNLSLAKLNLNTLDLEMKDETNASIEEISDILEKSLEDLRHLSLSLNADIIRRGGLKNSIERQMGFLKRGGKFNIHMDVLGEYTRLDETKEIILFRIMQEAINNIIRHSKATNIMISLHYFPDFLKMHIQDNGKGFNLIEKSNGTNHLNGIYNMQHRAKIINAQFEMDTAVGNGTSIIVTTPY